MNLLSIVLQDCVLLIFCNIMWLLLFLGSPGVTLVKEMLLPVTNSVWFVCEERSSTGFFSVHVTSCAPYMRSRSDKGMCDVSYHHSKMSGMGTDRTFVYLVGQAEFTSIIVDSWVRTGVLAFVGWHLLLGRGCRLCVLSRFTVLSEGSGKDLSRFSFGEGNLLSQGIWLIRSA